MESADPAGPVHAIEKTGSAALVKWFIVDVRQDYKLVNQLFSDSNSF